MAEVRQLDMEENGKARTLQYAVQSDNLVEEKLEKVPPSHRLLLSPSTGLSTGADLESLGQHHSSGIIEEPGASRGTQELRTEGVGDWSASAEGCVSVASSETLLQRQQRRATREAAAQIRVSREMADSLMTAIIGEISTQVAVASKRERMLEPAAFRPGPTPESVASFGSSGGYRSCLQSFMASAEDRESMRRLFETVMRDVGTNLPEGILSSAVDRKAPGLPSGEANPVAEEELLGCSRRPSVCSMASFKAAGQSVYSFEDWLAGLGELSEEVLQEICEHLDKHVFSKTAEAPENSNAEATPTV